MKVALLAIIAFVLLLSFYASYAEGKLSKSFGKDSDAESYKAKGKLVKSKVLKYLAKKDALTKESFTKTLQSLWNMSKGKELLEEGKLDAAPKGKAILKGKTLEKAQTKELAKEQAKKQAKEKAIWSKGKAIAKGKQATLYSMLKGKGMIPQDTKQTEKPSSDDTSTTANIPDYPQPPEVPEPSTPIEIPDNLLRDYAPGAIVEYLTKLVENYGDFLQEVNTEASSLTEPVPDNADPLGRFMEFCKKIKEGKFTEEDVPEFRKNLKEIMVETKKNQDDPRYERIRQEMGDLGEFFDALGEGVDSESPVTDRVKGVFDNFTELLQGWIQEKPENEENMDKLSQAIVDALDQFRNFIGQ